MVPPGKSLMHTSACRRHTAPCETSACLCHTCGTSASAGCVGAASRLSAGAPAATASSELTFISAWTRGFANSPDEARRGGHRHGCPDARARVAGRTVSWVRLVS
eukprot:5690005-Prymnesium_polylepis.2